MILKNQTMVERYCSCAKLEQKKPVCNNVCTVCNHKPENEKAASGCIDILPIMPELP